MSKLLKNRDLKMYAYLLCLGLLFLLWRGGELINQKMQALQIKALPPVEQSQIPTDTKAFYPVWIKQAAALKAEMAQAKKGSDVDELFRIKKDVVKGDGSPEAIKEPDFASMLKQKVRLDATADNGAVLNGRFYKIGVGLNELAIVRPDGGEVIPTLVGVTKDEVTIRVNKTNVIFKLQKSY